MKIDSYSKDIAAAATPENLIADASGSLPQPLYARQVFVRCPTGNTSDLLIGNAARQGFTVVKGATLLLPEVLRTGQAGLYSLADIYVKAGTNGDDVEILVIDPVTQIT